MPAFVLVVAAHASVTLEALTKNLEVEHPLQENASGSCLFGCLRLPHTFNKQTESISVVVGAKAVELDACVCVGRGIHV